MLEILVYAFQVIWLDPNTIIGNLYDQIIPVSLGLNPDLFISKRPAEAVFDGVVNKRLQSEFDNRAVELFFRYEPGEIVAVIEAHILYCKISFRMFQLIFDSYDVACSV